MKLTLGELLERRPAARPVLLLRADHVEGHPVCDHHRVTRGRKTQQQAGFVLAFLGRRTDVFGRLRHVLLRLLRNGKQLDCLFVVSAQTFQWHCHVD
ncbi:hypothetical protein [Streptomyces sp. NBC_00057]|uniref:hypothetical protein n=1 Tax=Streptomyces sp. NBC_00057 TaxID=2975634 RepID=UPI00386D9DB1